MYISISLNGTLTIYPHPYKHPVSEKRAKRNYHVEETFKPGLRHEAGACSKVSFPQQLSELSPTLNKYINMDILFKLCYKITNSVRGTKKKPKGLSRLCNPFPKYQCNNNK